MKKFLNLTMLIVLLFSCNSESSNDTSGDSTSDGQGGSLATFTLKNNYLYVVDTNKLNVFSINEEKNPVKVNSEFLGFDIETLFGYKNFLYIGSRNGMFIYDISNPEFPKQLYEVQHFTACDPVIANETHAFVTLHSNTFCGNDINVLEIYDVTKTTEPKLISSRNLVAPKGLGLYGNYLIVCDDEIKVFDVSNPQNSKLVNSFNRQAFDVIIQKDLLIAIGDSGLFQFKLSPDKEKGVLLEALSEIAI